MKVMGRALDKVSLYNTACSGLLRIILLAPHRPLIQLIQLHMQRVSWGDGISLIGPRYTKSLFNRLSVGLRRPAEEPIFGIIALNNLLLQAFTGIYAFLHKSHLMIDPSIWLHVGIQNATSKSSSVKGWMSWKIPRTQLMKSTSSYQKDLFLHLSRNSPN